MHVSVYDINKKKSDKKNLSSCCKSWKIYISFMYFKIYYFVCAIRYVFN